jgi:alkylhydroperoxidase family enzyme
MLPARVKRLLEHFHSQPGRLDPATRRAAATGGVLPAPLAAWVDKVFREAWRCTDEDVERLKQAGFDEDQIYEATVAAALGAAAMRMERGLRLVRGVGR